MHDLRKLLETIVKIMIVVLIKMDGIILLNLLVVERKINLKVRVRGLDKYRIRECVVIIINVIFIVNFKGVVH